MTKAEFTAEIANFLAKDYATNRDALARRMGASRPTIVRWATGESAPHPALRDTVLEWIRALDE